MTDIRPRFEFRVWGENLEEPTARLRATASPTGEAVTDETYVVAVDRNDVNAKIRGGVFDVKVLGAVSRGCERWQPWIKAEFPMSNSLLAEEVLPRLGTAVLDLDRNSYDLKAFIDEVVERHPQLRIAALWKRRVKYQLGGCFAEETEVAVDDHVLRTLAAESADLGALCDVRRRLGIEQFENVSYPRALKRALGWDRS